MFGALATELTNDNGDLNVDGRILMNRDALSVGG